MICSQREGIMCKCLGCGAILQDADDSKIGYTKNINSDLCERCFRIRHYNEYKFVSADNGEFIKNLEKISKTDDLVLLVVDLFNISKCLSDIGKILKNKIILVLTKRDLLPKSCYDKNLISFFDDYNLNIIDSIIISSKKNYNFDDLYNKINKYKTSKNVYIVGYSNSGKSTMINKFLYNYSDSIQSITTSNLPSTTIDLINIKVNNSLTLIDTPGLIDKGDIINYIDSSTLKKIIPNKEIKPLTYQVKNSQIFIIDNICRVDASNTNLTFYVSNSLNIQRIYKDTDKFRECEKRTFNVKAHCDIVIQGLGFINFKKECNVDIYINDVSVFIRKELV